MFPTAVGLVRSGDTGPVPFSLKNPHVLNVVVVGAVARAGLALSTVITAMVTATVAARALIDYFTP
jgi:hypothetical protein